MCGKHRSLVVYGIKLDYEDIDKIEEMCSEEEFDDVLDNWIIATDDTSLLPEFYLGIIIYSVDSNDEMTVYHRPTPRVLLETREYIQAFDIAKEVQYYNITQFGI